MDQTTTTTTPVSMTKEALAALKLLLDAIYEAVMLLVALLLWPLRWAGIVPPRDARDVAREVLAVGDDIVDPAVADEPAPLGDLIRRHAMARRWPEPGAPELAPLPPLVAAWLDRMDQFQLKTLTSGVPVCRIEQHVLAGADGDLVTRLGACTVEDIRTRPIQTRAAAHIEPALIEPAPDGEPPTLEEMLEQAGIDPVTLEYR